MKMKKIYFECAASLAMLSFSGCSDDINYQDPTGGEGRVFLRPLLSSDVKVESRAILTDEELHESALIWISNSKGVVRKYTGTSSIPAGGVNLVSDNYVAEVWAGDSVPASFEHRYFKGREAFAVSGGRTTQVDIECRIANTVVAVDYDDAVDNVLTDYTMTVGHVAGSLVYEGRDNRLGYFMMNSRATGLTYTLTAKKADGSEFTFTGEIADAKPATKYVLHVKHADKPAEDFGGALISIVVDETMIEVEDTIELYAAPTVEGTNFDLTKPIIGEQGKLTEKKLWIKSTKGFSRLEFACPEFATLLGISGNDFNIFGMAEDVTARIEAAGFSFQRFTHEAAETEAEREFEEVKVIMSADFMSLFPNGEHTLTVTVVDNNGRTTVTPIQIVVSDAKLMTDEVIDHEIWATHATLHGTVMKADVANVGFNYREAGTQAWTFVSGNVAAPAEGLNYSAEITGLTPGTTYEYVATSDDFTAATPVTFTTEAASQLPNAGMETWNTSSTPYLIAADGSSMFWDSGNHGSATMGKNITTPEETIKHSGNFSAKLESQFVGMGAIGKFAAGNIFVGDYLATDGTDGILGWGRAFTSRPKALKVWVKYTPQTVTYSKTDLLKKGDMDQGIIYAALVDDSKQSYTYKNDTYSWPCIVRTKSSDRNLFDKNGSNVIAYGERVFTEATAGDQLVEIEIPLDYTTDTKRPSNIILTCSSSRYGDYFTGGPSVMYVDDFELVY